MRICDTATLKLEHQFRAHNKAINVVAFHPTLPVVAASSDNLSVKLWNLRTGEMLDYRNGPPAAGCADKTTRVWPVGGIDARRFKDK